LVYGPEGSFLEANNSIGLALAMNVPLLYFLFRTETKTWLRALVAAMLVMSYPAVIFTYSRGAWLGLTMATAMLMLRIRHKFIFIAGAGAAAVLLASSLPRLVPQRLSDRYEVLVNYEEDSSAESRFWNWEFCRRVGMARPTIGGGFKFSSLENYAKYYPEFLERWPGKEWTCHSAWLTVFGEHGFPGFLLWIALLVCSLLSLRQVRSYAKAHPEMAWLAPYADAVQTAFVAFMVVGTFLDAAYFDMLYYLIAIVVIAKEITQAASRESLSNLRLTAPTGPVLGRRVAATD
jgi:probable O-glycosylation ligase (exosortase A-associated)